MVLSAGSHRFYLNASHLNVYTYTNIHTSILYIQIYMYCTTYMCTKRHHWHHQNSSGVYFTNTIVYILDETKQSDNIWLNALDLLIQHTHFLKETKIQQVFLSYRQFAEYFARVFLSEKPKNLIKWILNFSAKFVKTLELFPFSGAPMNFVAGVVNLWHNFAIYFVQWAPAHCMCVRSMYYTCLYVID